MRNSNAQTNPAYYAVIPAKIRYDENLKDKAKLLYGEITALANTLGYCCASNAYFADLYKVSEKTISRLIGNLKDCQYIHCEMVKKNGCVELRKIYIYDGQKSPATMDKIVPNDGQNCPSAMDKNVQGNNTSINIININNIYSHFNSKNIIKSRKLTSKLEKLIQSKLKDYSEKEIIKAIDNYATVVNDSNYYFDTRWNLEKFLKQSNAMPDFLDDGVKWINYIESKNKGGGDNGEARRNNGLCSSRPNIGASRNNKNKTGSFSSKVKSEDEFTEEERAAREELE